MVTHTAAPEEEAPAKFHWMDALILAVMLVLVVTGAYMLLS